MLLVNLQFLVFLLLCQVLHLLQLEHTFNDKRLPTQFTSVGVNPIKQASRDNQAHLSLLLFYVHMYGTKRVIPNSFSLLRFTQPLDTQQI